MCGAWIYFSVNSEMHEHFGKVNVLFLSAGCNMQSYIYIYTAPQEEQHSHTILPALAAAWLLYSTENFSRGRPLCFNCV